MEYGLVLGWAETLDSKAVRRGQEPDYLCLTLRLRRSKPKKLSFGSTLVCDERSHFAKAALHSRLSSSSRPVGSLG